MDNYKPNTEIALSVEIMVRACRSLSQQHGHPSHDSLFSSSSSSPSHGFAYSPSPSFPNVIFEFIH